MHFYHQSSTVILSRYMIRQVATTTALVLGFLVVMLLGGRLIRYFGMAAEGGLDVGVLWTLIGYNLPYFLELIFPLSFFIGLMLVFGRLYADHEMAVLNAGGVSRGMVSRWLIPLVLVVFVMQGFITLIGKPWGVAKATNIWQEQSVVEIFDLIRTKEFISSGDYHLYVGEVGDEREFLKDVIVIQMNGNKTSPTDDTQDDNQTNQSQSLLDTSKIPEKLLSDKDTIILAKSATQVPTASHDGSVVLDLHEGRRYEVDTASRQYNQVGFGRYRIHLTGKSDSQGRPMKIEGIATGELLSVRGVQGEITLKNSTFSPQQVRAELGYRLSLPFLMIIAVLLATPLATVRPRQGRWLKLIPAIFVFVANVLILISLKESIAKGKIGVYIYPVALVLFIAFALYLNYHDRIMAQLRRNRISRQGHQQSERGVS
ncbi:LPS export ABC transporter permease LptF [Moraxella bovis]|uniref:Lipopolysaccharide export system permease protein LptF n=1 Tax=Moraxella bovis TaxID=476 RepID=A0AAQ2SY71_MORBO|nr:LPS export ABC transporter permease LptF [Moraxella bovis]AWY19416.1 LPS export ABC transporter permease LptF [Moraxella bovis]UYZ76130.1 LPS export ABC transporter permease LptF [Moraxella bovis]UYZ77917.1 LPS export ABC transporter permease LptF [Moraxella bovis]UYZ80806.1 LPS export ABC transporter permease LptF [Moraxella bovis]UYZ86403.1 LPS export ABC transporter permease LptF [Moraxella bovis]